MRGAALAWLLPCFILCSCGDVSRSVDSDIQPAVRSGGKHRALPLFTSIGRLDAQANEVGCNLLIEPLAEDEDHRVALITIRNDEGDEIIRWDPTWSHSFFVYREILVVLTYDADAPPGKAAGEPNGALVAYDLKRPGVIRWRQELPAIYVRAQATPYVGTTRGEVGPGGAKGILLTLEVLGNEPAIYLVNERSGALTKQE